MGSGHSQLTLHITLKTTIQLEWALISGTV